MKTQINYLDYLIVLAIIAICLLTGCSWDVVVIPPPYPSQGYYYHYYPEYPYGYYQHWGRYPHYHRGR